jgi:Pentapeptide repeats (8 copies)
VGKTRILLAGVVGAVLAAGLSFGVQALAQGSNTTYYACLKNGSLSDVGTNSPNDCTAKHIISWNQEGPQGAQGPQGPQGPAGVTRSCSASPYPGMDLADCNLTGDDLESAPLDGANLTNSNLYEANLENAQLYGANLVNAGLNTVDLSNAILFQADLQSDDLRYSNLTNVRLMGANMIGVFLASTNLTDAVLTGANMTFAHLDGAIWSNTTCPDGTNSDNDGSTCVNDLTPTSFDN